MSQAVDIPRTAVRRRRLALAVAVTAAATLWAALQPEAPVSAPVLPDRASAAPNARVSAANATPGRVAATAPATAPTSAPASAPAWPAPARPRSDWPATPAHAVAAWAPVATAPAALAPRPAAVASAADKPVEAPAFPYTLIGRLDDGEARALLAGPTRSFGVKASDVIDGQWRVDAVPPRGLALTWLPGGIKKILALAPS